ncbi:hypothetical protein Bbelb_382720 [Branchiostoma belcheri]|nr:hypothetical protein Bbelb_382720 [Branchiostoma belcheri]
MLRYAIHPLKATTSNRLHLTETTSSWTSDKVLQLLTSIQHHKRGVILLKRHPETGGSAAVTGSIQLSVLPLTCSSHTASTTLIPALQLTHDVYVTCQGEDGV